MRAQEQRAHLRADRLAILHRALHAQLDVLTQIAQLVRSESTTQVTQEICPYSTNTDGGNQVDSGSSGRSSGLQRTHTSDSLVRSYSRGESLKRATWNGPSLSVTFTGARVIISPAPLHPQSSKAASASEHEHEHEQCPASSGAQSAHRGKMRACAIISSTLVLPELWSPTTTTCDQPNTRTRTYFT